MFRARLFNAESVTSIKDDDLVSFDARVQGFKSMHELAITKFKKKLEMLDTAFHNQAISVANPLYKIFFEYKEKKQKVNINVLSEEYDTLKNNITGHNTIVVDKWKGEVYEIYNAIKELAESIIELEKCKNNKLYSYAFEAKRADDRTSSYLPPQCRY
jgi:hypothetical protein